MTEVEKIDKRLALELECHALTLKMEGLVPLMFDADDDVRQPAWTAFQRLYDEHTRVERLIRSIV